MRKHKLYLCNERGEFDGFDRRNVYVDEAADCLRIGKKLGIPLREIVAVQVRPLPANAKCNCLAIDVHGPTLEGGEPTTILLLHRSFFGYTKDAPMRALADELAPMIEGNVPPAPSEFSEPGETLQGRLQVQYALNISLLIGFYRKLWFSYDTARAAVWKSLFLMLLCGVINIAGILLVAVPFDNFKMSRNLVKAGWSKGSSLVAYIILSFPAYIWWAIVIVGWTVGDART